MVGHVNIEVIIFSPKIQWTSRNFLPNILLKYESDASGFAYLYLIDWLETELIKKL